MLSKESEKAVLELDQRMLSAFMGGSGGKGLDDEREAFTPEDFNTLHRAVAELEPIVQRLIRICETVARQLARGERCSVCGMTAAQSKMAGYDCISEC